MSEWSWKMPPVISMRALGKPLELQTKAVCGLNEQELSPEVTTMAQERSNIAISLGNRFACMENSFVGSMSLAGFRRVNDKGDYLSPTISLSSDLSPSISCSSNSKVTLKCHICSKPPTTTFSSPLKRCLQCKRCFHLECHNPPIPIDIQQQDRLSTAWRCSRCSRRSSRSTMAKTEPHTAMRQSYNSQSYDRHVIQSSERPSKRYKLDANLPSAEKLITRLQDVPATNTTQKSSFTPSRLRWPSVQREVTKSCDPLVRPAVASNVRDGPDVHMVSGIAQLSHDATDIDAILLDRLSELAAVDTRLTYLLEGMVEGTLSHAENDEYTAYCTALTTDVSLSNDSLHNRASTGIITPQSLSEIGLAAPKQINLSYQPLLMSTALHERLSDETSLPRSPVDTYKTDPKRDGMFPVSDSTIIQSVEDPNAKINHQHENTCRKCFRDIPMTQEQLSGADFCTGCDKRVTNVKPQSFRTKNVDKTKVISDRTHREYPVSLQPMLAAGSRVRPRTPDSCLAAESPANKDNSPLFFSSPPRLSNLETAIPEVLAHESSSLASRERPINEELEESRIGEVPSIINDSSHDEPKPTSIRKVDYLKDVLRYKERVEELQKAIKDKDGAIEKLNKECQNLKRVEYDTGKPDKEVAKTQKDQYAIEAERYKVKSQLSSTREQILVKIKSPPHKHGSRTAQVEGLLTIKGIGQQDMKDDTELLNLRDQVDVLRRALACRDNPFPALQFGHKRLITAPLVRHQTRKEFPTEKRTGKRGRPPRNIAGPPLVQGSCPDESGASGSEFHTTSGRGSSSTTSEHRDARDEDEEHEDEEEEEGPFKTKNERMLRNFDRMAGVPLNPIACRADGMLAFKEGIRDAKGRLPRAKNVFKVGRDVPGQLR